MCYSNSMPPRLTNAPSGDGSDEPVSVVIERETAEGKRFRTSDRNEPLLNFFPQFARGNHLRTRKFTAEERNCTCFLPPSAIFLGESMA